MKESTYKGREDSIRDDDRGARHENLEIDIADSHLFAGELLGAHTG